MHNIKLFDQDAVEVLSRVAEDLWKKYEPASMVRTHQNVKGDCKERKLMGRLAASAALGRKVTTLFAG